MKKKVVSHINDQKKDSRRQDDLNKKMIYLLLNFNFRQIKIFCLTYFF